MPGRALLVTLAIALAAPAASAAAPAAKPVSCPKSGVVAKIAGKRTCLAKGRACATRYRKQYRHHGYNCVTATRKLKKIPQEF
jgi:hypothetical protein